MPNWVSVGGVWKPAKEKVGLTNNSGKPKIINGKTIEPGEPYIYEGPDRAALFELYEQKVESLGMKFETDPQMIELVRKLGFSSMKDYLTFVGVDVDGEEKKSQETLAASVTKHELPKRVKEIEVMSGGTETVTGKEIRTGGWDKPIDL